MSDLLPPNKPATFSARNIRTHYNRRKIGEVFHIDLEVEETVWNQLRTIPDNALIEIVAWWHTGDDPQAQVPVESKPEPKPKPQKGPYGEYWRILRAKDITNWPDFQEVLDCTIDHVWEALHLEFETETMSTVSPRQFEAWIKEKGLSEQLVTLSRTAEVKAAEKVN